MKIPSLCVPIGLPQNILPTRKNVTRWIANSTSSGNIPGLFEIMSPASIGAGGISLIGLVTGIIGLFNGSSKARWTGLLAFIGGVALDGFVIHKNGVLKGLIDLIKGNAVGGDYDTEEINNVQEKIIQPEKVNCKNEQQDAPEQPEIDIKNDPKFSSLVDRLYNGAEYQVRHNAAHDLGSSGDKRAVKPLTERLTTDPSWEVRHRIPFDLTDLEFGDRGEDTFQALLQNLEYDGGNPNVDGNVVYSSAIALGKFGDPRAIEALERVAKKHGKGIEEQANEAIKKIRAANLLKDVV